MSLPPKPKGKAFEKHPSCFGKLDCRGLCEVARRNGMMIISARKSDMMCFNDMALWGSAAAMKKTESEWTTFGNEPKPRNFKSVFGVDLDMIYEDWAEHQMPPVGYVRSKQIIPAGFVQIYGSEKVRAGDLAWNEGWTRWEKPQKLGEPAERYRFVIRKAI